MQLHPEELELARAYNLGSAGERLTPDQFRQVMARGRELHRWYKAHRSLHNAISAGVIAFLLGSDWLVPLATAHFAAGLRSAAGLIGLGLALGAVHSWLMYSLSIYSLHEGAAHNLIFPGAGALSRAAAFTARNLCRLAAADAEQYAACHMSHHAHFGTEEDAEFLNFIFPRRFWRSLLPLGTFLNYIDFYVHRSPQYTRSRVISALVAAGYNGAFVFLLYRLFGPLCAAVSLLVLPHAGFYLDRLRQFTEHNLMPLENASGARNLGLGFWGLLVGGGPWGQPCHLAHHLVASIPWYQQATLHRYITRLLDERQRRHFLLKPVTGFPLLVFSILRAAGGFSRQHRAAALTLGQIKSDQVKSGQATQATSS